MYQIISPNIPGSQPGGSSSDTPRRGPTNLTYVHIFFTNVRYNAFNIFRSKMFVTILKHYYIPLVN